MATTAVATIPSAGLPTMPSPDEFRTMASIAGAVVKSGLFPNLRTEAAALAVVMTARELRLPPMFGCNNIHMVEGKPTLGAHIVTAIILRDHGDDALIFEQSTDETCVISYKRRSWGQRRTYAFTRQMADRAGLLGRPNHKAHPAAMLRARCVGHVGRMGFADSLAGIFVTQEIDADAPFEGEAEVAAPAVAVVEREPQDESYHDPDDNTEIIDGEWVETVPPARPQARPMTPAQVSGKPPVRPEDAASEAQRRLLWALAKENGWTESGLKESLKELFDIESSTQMTKWQASRAIDMVKGNLVFHYDESGRAVLVPPAEQEAPTGPLL